jgi:hypothetical protein
MPISEATLRQVRYGIEQIPDSWYGNVPLNSEPTPAVLDLKRLNSLLLRLTAIQVTASAAVILRARYDGILVEENSQAMLNLFPGAWNLPAKDTLYFNFFGTVGAPVANYPTFFSLWTLQPTIAQKLLMGIKLSSDETALAQKLGIADSVQKGVLPLPISQQIEREYTVIGEETHSRSVNIAAPNVVYTIENLYTKPGEIMALTRIAAAPGGAANVVRIVMDRDNDVGYVDLRTFPLSLIPGGEVACFIPFLTEMKITCQAAVAPGAHLFRYTFQRIKLNTILRARLGLATRDELPGDVYDKVIAGVL